MCACPVLIVICGVLRRGIWRGQASMAVIGDGRLLAVFRVNGDGPTATSNTSTIEPFYQGGNQGMNVWQARQPQTITQNSTKYWV